MSEMQRCPPRSKHSFDGLQFFDIKAIAHVSTLSH